MRVSQRFRFPMMFCLALIVANGFDFIRAYLQRKNWGEYATVVEVVFVGAYSTYLAQVNSNPFASAFPTLPKNDLPYNKNFQQIRNLEQDEDIRLSASMFPAALQNLGTTACYESWSVPIEGTPRESEAYKGEQFLYGTNGNIDLEFWSPNWNHH